MSSLKAELLARYCEMEMLQALKQYALEQGTASMSDAALLALLTTYGGSMSRVLAYLDGMAAQRRGIAA